MPIGGRLEAELFKADQGEDDQSAWDTMERSTRRLAISGVIWSCIYLIGLLAALLLWRSG